MRVHAKLGPGLLESTYEVCMSFELDRSKLSFQRQVPVPIKYGPLHIDCAYRADFIIENQVIIELKSVAKVDPIHIAQVMTYLKLARCKVALLINFNVPYLPNGIKRLII